MPVINRNRTARATHHADVSVNNWLERCSKISALFCRQPKTIAPARCPPRVIDTV